MYNVLSGGSPKSRQKEKISWFVTVTRGGGQKIPKICGCHIWRSLTCLKMPLQTVPLSPTRNRNALRGGFGQAQDPARRPQRHEVVVVGIAVADELVPEGRNEIMCWWLRLNTSRTHFTLDFVQYFTCYHPNWSSVSPLWPELMGSLKLGNVWVFVQLIHRPTSTKNQLYKNPNIS